MALAFLAAFAAEWTFSVHHRDDLAAFPFVLSASVHAMLGACRAITEHVGAVAPAHLAYQSDNFLRVGPASLMRFFAHSDSSGLHPCGQRSKIRTKCSWDHQRQRGAWPHALEL